MRMMKVPAREITIACAIVLALGSGFSTTTFAEQGTQRDWSYSGLQFAGPSGWGDISAEYGACKTGRLQSPINISSTTAQKATLPQIVFQYSPTYLRLVNTGHTTQVNPDKGGQIVVGGETYGLIQYHFHAPSGSR